MYYLTDRNRNNSTRLQVLDTSNDGTFNSQVDCSGFLAPKGGKQWNSSISVICSDTGNQINCDVYVDINQMAFSLQSKAVKKNKIKKSFFALLCFIAITSCGELNRFKTATLVDDPTINKYVTVSLFTTKTINDAAPPVTTKTKTLWDLQAEGQAALVDKLADKSIDKAPLFTALNQTYFESDGGPAVLDFTTKNLSLILSVAKVRDYSNGFINYTPADRIDYLNMNLDMKNADISKPEIIKWNKFETKFDTIKIADVTNVRTFDTNITAHSGTDASPLGVQAVLGNTNSKTVAQTIGFRFITLRGTLKQYGLTLEEEGTRDIDLSDNLLFNITLKFKPINQAFAIFDNLYDKKTELINKTDAVTLKTQPFMMPDYPESTDLKADITFNYNFRHVTSNYKSYPEYDDKVNLIKGKGNENDIVLCRAADIKPKRWILTNMASETVHYDVRGKKTDLLFSSFEQAELFKYWLNNLVTADDKVRIEIAKNKKTAATATAFDVWLNGYIATNMNSVKTLVKSKKMALAPIAFEQWLVAYIADVDEQMVISKHAFDLNGLPLTKAAISAAGLGVQIII